MRGSSRFPQVDASLGSQRQRLDLSGPEVSPAYFNGSRVGRGVGAGGDGVYHRLRALRCGREAARPGGGTDP